MSHKIIEFDDEEATHSTKSSRNETRRQENKAWKANARSNWSDEDPNPRHKLYYAIQLPDIAPEWCKVREFMARDLLVSFRLCGRAPFVYEALKLMMDTTFRHMRGRFKSVKGTIINEVVVPVEWCRGAYQINTDGSTLAKDESFEALHTLLCREVKLGHIVRQELVSMIPAIFLDVLPSHDVLDMCAAPGSKTEQLLAALSRSSAGEYATGYLVANDADPKRMRTLRERYRNCTQPNLIFTCATAQHLEKHLLCSSGTRDGGGPVQFDRIICDVPCSGDGTFRKSPHLWRLFRPRFGVELHPLQLDIAKSSLRLLRVGGRLVYSTCSLNPIEDEAVVSALVIYAWQQGMNLRVVDPRTIRTDTCEGNKAISLMQYYLPGLKYRPGVRTWKCDEETFLVGENESQLAESRSRLPPLEATMCPQFPETGALADALCLENCMRIVPQDMNTGGFFVAVLELFSGRPPAAYAQRGETAESIADGGSGIAKKRFLDRGTSGNDELIMDEQNKPQKRRALKAFQELGYNPKVAATAMSTLEVEDDNSSKALKRREKFTLAWREESAAVQYVSLDTVDSALREDLFLTCEQKGCRLEALALPGLKVFVGSNQVSRIKGKGDKQSKKATRRPVAGGNRMSKQLVISSAKVAAALTSWGANGDIIVQAGVSVADITMHSSLVNEVRDIHASSHGAQWLLHLCGMRQWRISIKSMQQIIRAMLAGGANTEGPEGSPSKYSEFMLPLDNVSDVIHNNDNDNAATFVTDNLLDGQYIYLSALWHSTTAAAAVEESSIRPEKETTTAATTAAMIGAGKRHLSRAERKQIKAEKKKPGMPSERVGRGVTLPSNHTSASLLETGGAKSCSVHLVLQRYCDKHGHCWLKAICPDHLLESYDCALSLMCGSDDRLDNMR